MDDPMHQAQFLTSLLGHTQEHHFRMEWNGSKIPRGARINGVNIGWTQHGRITGENREALGYYDREMEFGGANAMTHVMIIRTQYADVTPPPGGTVVSIGKSSGQSRL